MLLKQSFFGVLGIFLSCAVMGQGVSIGDNAMSPDPSAILDLQSKEKGLLTPRLTSAQRLGLSSPAKGLFVFDTGTDSFWYWDGSTWQEIISSVTEKWFAVGGNISNSNSGFVGIGETVPQARLDVRDMGVIGDITVGTESTSQEASNQFKKGFTTTPWLYTQAIQAQAERGSGGVLITLGDDDNYGANDEIHFVTSGASQMNINNAGLVTIENNLSVKENTISNNFLYQNKQVRYYAIPPAAWRVANSNTSMLNDVFNAGFALGSSGLCTMVAPVDLPDGAIVEEITWRVTNTSPNPVSLRFYYSDNVGSSVGQVVDILSIPPGSSTQTITSSDSSSGQREIANLKRHYFLMAEGVGIFKGDFSVRGVWVTYTVRQVD